MNYESMSDFEINKAVADLLEIGVVFDEFVFGNDEREVVYLCEKDGLDSIIPVGEFNPCNNPADAWDIIIENEISINKLKCEPLWIADKGGDYVRNKNPLRAAMIVFLMMQND